MTRTLTLNATVAMPGGTITLNLTDVDLDRLAGNERVLLDAFAGALGLARTGPTLAVAAATSADPAKTAEAVRAHLTDEDRAALRDPGTLKNRAKARKAPAPGPKPGKATGTVTGTVTGCAASILTGLADEGSYTGSARGLGELYGTGTEAARSQMVNQLLRDGAIRKEGPRGKATYTITATGLDRIGRSRHGDAPTKPASTAEPARTPEPEQTTNEPEPAAHPINLATLPRERKAGFDPDAARAAAASAL